ncbi:MAG TPA: FGGY-family carbohydrate kinase [Caulobacteraceae bacterium]|jgi:glycerol kinase
MPEFILALDAGTTSVRAAIFGLDGTVRGQSATTLVTHHGAGGLAEQDAETVWNAVRQVIAGALAGASLNPADIAAIGLATQRTSAVVWDRRGGAALTPLVLWSDLRGTETARALAANGFPVAPQQAAAKLGAMLATLDVPASRMAWGGLDSFLIFRLSGGAAHITERSQAWPTGYLDLADLGWNRRLIAHQAIDAGLFPMLVDSWGALAVTDPSAFGARVAIAADLADQQSALLAHGAGAAKITFGTAAAMDVDTGAALVFVGAGLPPLIASSVGGQSRFCVEGMINSAGQAIDWLRERFALGDHALFDTLAGDVVDTAGAAFLPALPGLGAPDPDPARRAMLTGLSGAVERGHLARAGYEGVAFRVRQVVERLAEIPGLALPEVIGLDGGLSRSAVFVQILADLIGAPVRRHAFADATLLGAALAAARGAGLAVEEDALIRFKTPVAPRLSRDAATQRFMDWKAALALA